MGEYAAALAAGTDRDDTTRDAIVVKLHEFTGLPEDYLRRANLRVSADEFRQELLRDRGLVVGATDTRFTGHALDRMNRRARYDPTDTAINSAYLSTFNDYVRRVLKYARRGQSRIGRQWTTSAIYGTFSTSRRISATMVRRWT